MADDGLYPWGGDIMRGEASSPVVVVTMGGQVEVPADLTAVWGPLRTENIGIETLIANVLSNPRLRFVVLVGADVRGHLSGASLLALVRNGLDERRRIIGAPGAVPFVENIGDDAIERFRQQVEVIDLLGETGPAVLRRTLEDCRARNPGPMNAPFAVERVRHATDHSGMAGGVGVHATVIVDPYGEVRPAEVNG
ncbi:MAG: hypothetical protein QF415_07100 [Candidatus Undinarchaeales archaeon]|nr:hypothetical protein [Candidatus Undinarchaeales archaeon]MDP7494034.1 hypothetical protein [Candidatus Undinarchaeales archaeon]